MERKIDLLRIKEKASEREVRLKRFLQVGSTLLLIFYLLVLGGVFSFWVIQQQESRTVRDKIRQAEAKIGELKRIESLQVALKERLKALTSVFEEEEIDYKDVLTQLEQLTPSGVNLESFDLTKKGEIKISGSAENSLGLGEFLANLTGSEEASFGSIALSSVARTEEGAYDFSLKILLKAS